MRAKAPATALALALLAGWAPAQKPVGWLTNLATAQCQARTDEKPLLLVVHHATAPDAAEMAAVYSHSRFRLAARKIVPFLACWGAAGAEADLQKQFGVAAEDVAQGHQVARALFTSWDSAPAPQQLILHPEGDVLWHGVGSCSALDLARGIDRAVAAMRKKPAERRKLATKLVDKLADQASDPNTYVKLAALARHGDEMVLGHVLDALGDHQSIGERVLRDATRGIPPDVGRDRLAKVRPVAANLRMVMAELIEELDRRARPKGDAIALREPLPALGKIADFGKTQFVDGVDRGPIDAEATLTVVWVFLADDPMMPRQAGMLGGVHQELASKAVRFVGLGATTDPEQGLIDVDDAGLPFPSGAYPYDANAAMLEVKDFPTAFILDAEGNVLFRSTVDDMKRSYTCFAPTLRGMLKSPFYF
ncbi:MAG: hypothetical protein AAF628_11730 [Planctomycetota bacterium]